MESGGGGSFGFDGGVRKGFWFWFWFHQVSICLDRGTGSGFGFEFGLGSWEIYWIKEREGIDGICEYNQSLIIYTLSVSILI